MKKAVLILIIGLSLFSAGAQNIIWATPAKLQVYGMTNDGRKNAKIMAALAMARPRA